MTDHRRNNQNKRSDFALSIRKEKKKEIILSLRQKLIRLPQYEGEKISEQVSNEEIYNNIKIRTQLKESLQALTRQILSKNQNEQFQIQKFFDAGMKIPIMALLKEQICMKEVFELISSILSKQKVKVADKFIKQGLMQNLVKQFNDQQLVEVISNIFLNLAVQSQDYVEMMLLNNIHKLMIKQFYKIIESNHYHIDPIYYKKTLSFIFGALTNLVNTQIGNIGIQSQLNDIFDFSCRILQMGIFPKDCIVIIYQITQKSLVEGAEKMMTPLMNKIASQITQQAQELEYFLILLNLVTPIQIDYRPIFYLMFKAKEKNHKPCFRIIQKLASDQKGVSYLQEIKNNQIWWEKLILKIQQKQFLAMLQIIKKMQVQFDCVYKFFDECLSSMFNTNLIVQTFLILHYRLNKTQSIQNKKVLVNRLQNAGIQQKLINLAVKETFPRKQQASVIILMMRNIKKEKIQSALQIQ